MVQHCKTAETLCNILINAQTNGKMQHAPFLSQKPFSMYWKATIIMKQYFIIVPLTILIIMRDVCLLAAGFIMRYKTLEPPKTIARYFDPSLSTMRIKPTGISKVRFKI